MDPFEPIRVDPEAPEPGDPTELKPAPTPDDPTTKMDAADIALAAAHTAAFVTLTGIGGRMEAAMSGGAEVYGDAVTDAADDLTAAAERYADSVGGGGEGGGCGAGVLALLVTLTIATGSALAMIR